MISFVQKIRTFIYKEHTLKYDTQKYVCGFLRDKFGVWGTAIDLVAVSEEEIASFVFQSFQPIENNYGCY